METFEYKAVNKKGNASSGTLNAENKQVAAEKLIKQGYRPLIIKQRKSGFDPNNIKIPGFTDRVKTRDMVIFTRQLSTMINAGVPLVRALATLGQQTDSQYFKKILLEVTKAVESGQTFGDSLAKHPKVFSEVYVNMVRAGETGGILDDILKKLATQQEKDASIKKKIRGAMTYPIILMVIMVIAFFILSIWVLPSINKMILSLSVEGTELPFYTTLMMSLSDFMVAYWWIIVALIIASSVTFTRWVHTKKGRYIFDKLLLKVPIIKTLIIKVAVARFSRIFASLMTAGVAVTESLNVTAEAMSNKVIEEEIKNAAKQVVNGKQLSEPLAESSIFPPIVSQMLAVGEETGKTDVVLLKVADFYEEEVDTVIDALASIIEPIMILIMGAAVAVIAVSVIGPISSLSQSIQ